MFKILCSELHNHFNKPTPLTNPLQSLFPFHENFAQFVLSQPIFLPTHGELKHTIRNLFELIKDH